MDVADQRPDYKEIYRRVKELFDKSGHFNHGPYDETFYTLRVYETAKQILSQLEQPVKQEVVLVAAILHDSGKSALDTSKLDGDKEVHKAEWRRHPALSVPIARQMLSELGHSLGFIEEVCYLVERHDWRKGHAGKSIELQVLQDADILADCGVAGFIRPFLYSGRFKRDVIGNLRYMLSVKDRAEDDEMLNLDASKRMAVQKVAQYRELLALFAKELESDLL